MLPHVFPNLQDFLYTEIQCNMVWFLGVMQIDEMLRKSDWWSGYNTFQNIA